MRNYENYDGWKERDVLIHKCINWEERNWEEFDTEETIMMPIKVYGKDYDSKKLYTFHKMIRPNAIYPPYWKCVDLDVDEVLGGMYDSRDYDGYGIHDRFESQEVYDALYW